VKKLPISYSQLSEMRRCFRTCH